MKKLLLILAVLLMVGVSNVNAQQIITDGKTTEGGASIYLNVYNNSGSALDEGDVVVWDIASSTGDNDLYVTTSTTADTVLVAGVVAAGGIPTGAQGNIIIYGLAQCDIGANGIAVGNSICTSGSAGTGDACATAGVNMYGIGVVAGTSDQVECFVRVN